MPLNSKPCRFTIALSKGREWARLLFDSNKGFRSLWNMLFRFRRSAVVSRCGGATQPFPNSQGQNPVLVRLMQNSEASFYLTLFLSRCLGLVYWCVRILQKLKTFVVHSTAFHVHAYAAFSDLCIVLHFEIGLITQDDPGRWASKPISPNRLFNSQMKRLLLHVSKRTLHMHIST